MADTDEGDSLQDWKLGHWPVQFALWRLQSELGVHLDGGCSLFPHFVPRLYLHFPLQPDF